MLFPLYSYQNEGTVHVLKRVGSLSQQVLCAQSCCAEQVVVVEGVRGVSYQMHLRLQFRNELSDEQNFIKNCRIENKALFFFGCRGLYSYGWSKQFSDSSNETVNLPANTHSPLLKHALDDLLQCSVSFLDGRRDLSDSIAKSVLQWKLHWVSL